MAVQSTSSEPTPARMPALFLFDGQNLFKGTREIFGETRWRTDPKKLAAHVADSLGLAVHGVRFYSGIPRWDRHRDMRAFWERKQEDFRSDGIATRFRELRYKGPQDRSGREKGIDVGIALDAFEAVVEGEVGAIVIFSQDNDLDEIPIHAEKYLDREAKRTGVLRKVTFFSAFAHDAAQERAARAWSEGDGERPRVNYCGISGGKYRWVKLGRSDFAACADDREAALDAQKVDLPAELERISKKHRKRMTEDYDVLNTGGGFVRGRVLAVLRLPSRGVIVFEQTADLLAVKVSSGSLPGFADMIGKSVHAAAEGHNGEVSLQTISVSD